MGNNSGGKTGADAQGRGEICAQNANNERKRNNVISGGRTAGGKRFQVSIQHRRY